MNLIHPSAMIGKDVKLGDGNKIGPGVVIEDGVAIGERNVFYPNAYVGAGTQMGNANEIHMGAVLGHLPQDLAFVKGTPSFTKIGNENVIREYVTIHRGTKEGTSTVIGNNNYFMANAHIAHNCQLGNRIILVNLASLTGYCIVEDQVFISGMVGFHQFTRIGRLAIVSALSAANKDIPPFTMCGGRPARAQGLNSVGLRRAGVTPASRSELKKAFKLLYREGLSVSHACETIEKELASEEVKHLLGFIRASKRGIVAARDLAVEMKSGEGLEDADDGA